MNDIYCTYFDQNYLSRATLMIKSLRRFDSETPIYVLALSKLCETILHELALHKVEIIPLETLEAAYPELVSIKPTRKPIEYYFTLSPFLPHYLFSQTTVDRITYIDADLYFFTSPRPVLDSLGDASLAITPHRFSFGFRDYVVYGRFNVGWITYRRCVEGLKCLDTYKAECAVWCCDRVENGRFGDQKYLDAWLDRYPRLKIIDHKGFNLAIWNAHGYTIQVKDERVMLDDDPLIFYHFAQTQLLPDGAVEVPALPRGGRSKAVLLKYVLKPYKDMLEEERRILERLFPSLSEKSDVRFPPAVRLANS